MNHGHELVGQPREPADFGDIRILDKSEDPGPRRYAKAPTGTKQSVTFDDAAKLYRMSAAALRIELERAGVTNVLELDGVEYFDLTTVANVLEKAKHTRHASTLGAGATRKSL